MMGGYVLKTSFISRESGREFAENLSEAIDSMQAENLTVEVQYQSAMQPNGQALFSAVILGRK